MEDAYFSKVLVNSYDTTWGQIPGGCILHKTVWLQILMTHKEQDVTDQRDEVQHTTNNALPHPLVYQIICSQDEQRASHEPANRRDMLPGACILIQNS
jgi:hypothetical protein